jgi:hypothetical protein
MTYAWIVPRRSLVLVLSLLAALSLAAGGVGRGAPLVVASGKVVLPLSGLVIELPAAKHQWSVSASWALDKDGGFDARDVIDEKDGDKLVAGSWVLVGHFVAGGCQETVRQADLAGTWEGTSDLWGASWHLRGGIFTFDKLGKKPAVAMCTTHTTGRDRKALLLYRFFLDQPEAMSREAMQKALSESVVLERTARAFLADAAAPGLTSPLGRPEVRQRGELAAARTVRLDIAELDLALPDDKTLWVREPTEPQDTTDWLARMVPAVPELTAEVLRSDAATCKELFAQFDETVKVPPPTGLAKGWEVGPTLLVERVHERTACRKVGSRLLLVGFFSAPDSGDLAPFRSLLEALERAAAPSTK